MNYLVINNPASGKSGNKNEAKLKDALEHKDHQWIDTDPEISLSQQISVLSKSYDCVVISGGDGTVNDAIQTIKTLDWKARLLIYPTGTTNEFAMHRGFTQASCLREIEMLNSTEKYFDAGLIDNKRWFIYSLSFGTITKLSYMTPQEYKNKLGYFGYWVYGFISRFWMKIKDYDMKITIDDKIFEGEYLFGSVTNSYSLGNVLKLNADDVAFDDGLFEVMLIKKPKKFKHYREIIQGLLTKNYNSDYITFMKAKSIDIMSKHKVSWNVDGEFYARNQAISIVVKEKTIHC